MRVFVTGASGGIGSAVVPELLATGHKVVGLARSDASAEALAAAGAEVQRGDLADLESLRVAAAQSDGVIHLAFSNDFTNLDEGIAEETRAIATLCGALEGSGKPLVIVSGTPVVRGRASTEQDPTMTEGPVGGRGRASLAALAYAERGVRVGLVRLPRSVHAAGGPYGFASVLVAAAQRTRCPATSETAPSAGRPSTGSTPHGCSGSCSSRASPAPSPTPSATKETRCERSPRRSAGSSTCRSRRSQRRTSGCSE